LLHWFQKEIFSNSVRMSTNTHSFFKKRSCSLHKADIMHYCLIWQKGREFIWRILGHIRNLTPSLSVCTSVFEILIVIWPSDTLNLCLYLELVTHSQCSQNSTTLPDRSSLESYVHNAYKTSHIQLSTVASFHMEEAEIERQLINDTHSDCGTDDSDWRGSKRLRNWSRWRPIIRTKFMNCNVGLFISGCFRQYNTKAKFS
jgi:hypothetical protein